MGQAFPAPTFGHAAEAFVIAHAAPGASSTKSPSAGVSSGHQATSVAAAKVSLDIRVRGSSGAVIRHSTLRCVPAGGTHAKPAAACRALLRISDPFQRRPRRTMCPLTYVRPQTATVTGTWFGHHVNHKWYHGDCGMRRWDKVIAMINRR